MMTEPTAANENRASNERRATPRRRSLLSGKLTTADTQRSYTCTIRNLSERGARITLAGGEPLPAETWLIVSKEGLAMRTRTVWRHGSECGVDFVEAHDLSRSVPAHIAGLRRMWIDQLPR
jgi:hypothetical protein